MCRSLGKEGNSFPLGASGSYLGLVVEGIQAKIEKGGLVGFLKPWSALIALGSRNRPGCLGK